MTRSQQDLVRISDAAALWVQKLKHDDSAQTRAEFDKWLRQGGPAYLDEFLLAQMMWEALDGLDPSFDRGVPTAANDRVVEFPVAGSYRSAALTPSPTVGEGGARSRESEELGNGEGNRAGGEGLAPSQASKRRRWHLAIAASILVVAGTVALVASLPFGARTYATTVGGQEAIKLIDGSIIHLNTHSRAEVRFSEHVREVRLVEGEALFTVAHDAARPFIVITDNARVRALGTQFNVYRTGSDATRVAVLEGVVQVTTTTGNDEANGTVPAAVATKAPVPPSPSNGAGRGEEFGRAEILRLTAGDEAEVDGHRLVKAATPDVQRAVSWRARRLVFAGDRVDYIAGEFNRYSRVQIRIEGPIRERRMGGTFDADDPMPMVRYLSHDPNVQVIKSETEILIRPRHDGDPSASAQ